MTLLLVLVRVLNQENLKTSTFCVASICEIRFDRTDSVINSGLKTPTWACLERTSKTDAIASRWRTSLVGCRPLPVCRFEAVACRR